VTGVSCFFVPVCSKSGTLPFVIHFPVHCCLSFVEGKDTVLPFTPGSHYPQMLCNPRRTKAPNVYSFAVFVYEGHAFLTTCRNIWNFTIQFFSKCGIQNVH